jgi:hypothetical protein
LNVDTTNSKPDLYILPAIGQSGPCAHCHLTRGANKSGNGQTFGEAIKMTCNVDILLGPSDAQDWSFNFLQFANLMVRSALWGGRVVSEGSVSINYAIPPAFPTNPSLDSTVQFDPFVNLLSSPQSQVQQGGINRITLTRVMGDHPNSNQPLQVTNFATKCPNFLFNMRLDVGFTTVFVGRSPSNLVISLAHFTWHVIYDAKFTWAGGSCTGTMVNGRLDVGPVKTGAPTDPTLQTLLKTPKSPFYNKLNNNASTLISNTMMPPNYVESLTRDSSIPSSFFT